ncbi:hypothetical protein GOP47_0029444 [Adiantum capillus-veneris]|nr:hypothetical protein GOP47_0029444 [Adiantum capillus-veneris]
MGSLTAPEKVVGRPLKIIGLAGSMRKASGNKGLLRAVAEIAEEEYAEAVQVEIVEIGHLPFVNPDLEQQGIVPESVLEFRRKVKEADAVIFAAPEYNYSVSAVLKNALDWASRPPNMWAAKPAAVLSAAGGSGGSRAQYHLRQIGVFLDLHFINKPEVFVKAHEGLTKFDLDGNLIDADTRARVRQLLVTLRTFTLRLLAGSCYRC